MADEVKVITQDLRTKAVEIENIQFSGLMSKPLVIPPDQLTLSKTAVDNLNQNASFLYRNQDYGDREGDRLAETLQSVAEAYDLADASAAANIDGIGAPQTPKLNTIPAPTMPAPMGSPLGLTADEIGDVEVAQQQLSAGDHGASLREAAAQWMANGNALQASSQQFKVKIENWEGDAADQAYAKFVSYGEWLSQLGESWQKLAAEAMRISDAHVKALLNHTPVYQNYEQLKSQMIAAIANGGSAAHTLGLEMEELQRQSEEIIEGYSKEAAPQRVTPPTPPPSGVPAVPVTGNGKPRKSGPGSDFQTPPGSGTGGGGGGGGGQPPSMSPPTASPLGADPAGGGAPQTGESPAGAGAGAGGGQPSGGGAPSGGAPGGGMPSLPGSGPEDMPALLDDPSLHPASADAGGGAGGGSGGGAGGGGAGSIPLQPNVGGVSVAPGPTAGGTGGGPAGAGGPGGAMGGGMGGAHGGQAQGGKEKRRTPGLSPDEDLYVEDRDYTEEVIGDRKRRTVQDPKDSK
ncbi:PPE domain-containing protein [Mycobacterium antarcticum]|uniref:PPE domain-containing protein n=1 Tax=Mycolicibacterium sp. TUM20984 TaxID=3023368 RepID=UPI002399787F|nr:PPE domain-containing protein [Mycolicibacterium sp. TUM20984]GLP78694.1 hypothetical protein TUM20984_01140 [Mycolicibacterium sp. TUM20984]